MTRPDPSTSLPKNQRFLSHVSRDGIYVGGYDVSYSEDMGLSVEQEPGIFLGLMLSGRSTSIRLNGTGEFDIPVGRPIVMNFGELTECTNYYKAGEHCAGIGINLPAACFEQLPPEGIGADLAPLKTMLEQPTDIEVLPACPELARLANQVLACSDRQASAALALEGLSLLLLARFCDLLSEAREQPDLGNLSKAEWQRVQKVTQHLEAHLDETPSLGALSKLAGINQTTLSDQFKMVHGETIFAYLRNKRLETARSLLRTDGMSVTEVSFEVGFSSSTSFTTAYRRRFGYPPSQETSNS